MKIYLAGLENGGSMSVVRTGIIRDGFVSYYYIRAKRKNKDLLAEIRQNTKNIIIDSGAHTFFSELSDKGLSVSVHIKRTKTKDSPEEYFKKYKNWLVENYDLFDYYVELDIGEIVGQDKVLQWREELKQANIYNKCITVMHPEVVDFNAFIATLEDSQSKYVALEGDRPKRPRLQYNKYIKECYNRGVKVHGFAMTKEDVYNKYPFYSVDSTSWKAGTMYGVQRVIVKNENKNIKFKSKKQILQIDDSLAIKALDKNKEVSKNARLVLAIKAYQKRADEITRLWEKRGIKWD